MGWVDSIRTALNPTGALTRLRSIFRLPRRFSRDLLIGLLVGVALSLSSTSAALLYQEWKRKKTIRHIPPRPIELRADEIADGVIGLIGNTPLIRINSLSDALGVEILGKCEFVNPGGSVKDRVALRIIEDAEADGLLHPHTGSVLFEGTVGSTGISLATVGKAKGYECCIIMPDDVAIEKVQVLEKLGARVERVRPASYVDEKQFVNAARKRARDFGRHEVTSHRPASDTPETKPDLLITVQGASGPPTPLASRAPSARPSRAGSPTPSRQNSSGRLPSFSRQNSRAASPAPSSSSSSSSNDDSPASSTLLVPGSTSSSGVSIGSSRPKPRRSRSYTGGGGSGTATPSRVRFRGPPTPVSGPQARGGDTARPRGFFCDQFENQSNFDAHYHGTGPEILRQVNGELDAFVSGAGTGGTISGIGRFLKGHLPEVKVVLSDPEGSGLYNKVKYNVMYDAKESEGRKRRHQVDTVVEGIGVNRITHNFAQGLDIIDDAYRVSDAEAVAMSRYLVTHDGLFLGSSSACNLVACVRLAKRLGQGTRIVTILCDSGARHQSKFWSDEYLRANGIEIRPELVDALLAE